MDSIVPEVVNPLTTLACVEDLFHAHVSILTPEHTI